MRTSRQHLLGGLIALACLSPASEALSSEADRARLYVEAVAIARRAKANCGDIVPDEITLERLMHTADLRRDDAKWVEAQLAIALPKLDFMIASVGKGQWCKTMWHTYGPMGLGVLRSRTMEEMNRW